MPRVSVRITRLLAEISGAERTTTIEAANASEAIGKLCERVPALRVHVFDDAGNVRPHVNVFVRGELTKGLAALDLAVADGDEVSVVQAVSGGQAERAT